VIPSVYPVIGQKRGSDGFHRVSMAGDGEKNDPLFIKREGVSERVKSAGLNGYKVRRIRAVG
jgi:hypothetical protein